MSVYMLKCDFSTREDLVENVLAKLEEFDHIQIMPDTWFFSTDLDIEGVDAEFNDFLEEIGIALIMEVLGDFTIQGLEEESMEWIETHLDEGEEDDEE